MKKNLVCAICAVVTMFAVKPTPVTVPGESGVGLQFPITFWMGMIVLMVSVYGILQSREAQKKKSIKNSSRKTSEGVLEWMKNGEIY